MIEYFKRKIVTEEDIKNSDAKEYFNRNTINPGDEVFFCYFKGYLFKKHELEHSQSLNNFLLKSGKEFEDFETKIQVALTEKLILSLKDNLTFCGYDLKTEYPIFLLKGEIDHVFADVSRNDFMSNLLAEFGSGIVENMDVEFSKFGQELTIDLYNNSYTTKFRKFLEKYYENSKVYIAEHEKFLVCGDTVEETYTIPFKSFSLFFNVDKKEFDKQYKDMHDLSKLKSVFTGTIDEINDYYENKKHEFMNFNEDDEEVIKLKEELTEQNEKD